MERGLVLGLGSQAAELMAVIFGLVEDRRQRRWLMGYLDKTSVFLVKSGVIL